MPLCLHRFSDIFALSTGDSVRPACYRNGPLGVFPDRDAGNAQASGFLLNAAGIRYHDFRLAHQAKKIKIPKRLEHMNPVTRKTPFRPIRPRLTILEMEEGLELEFADALLRSRVRRKENWVNL